MKILITGATGFLGKYLLKHLAMEHKIIALARNPRPDTSQANTSWVQQDLALPLDYTRLPARIDAVIHLAQSRFYRQFPKNADDVVAVNIQSSFRLMEYARRADAQCFILASSGGLYGLPQEKCLETSPISFLTFDNPLRFYFTSKYIAELLLANFQPFFRTVILRFFFVYGPGQEDMLISNLLHKVQMGEKITIQGRPGVRINPIFVEDAVRVFEPALHLNTSNLFNIAGDDAVTITDLVRLIEKVTGRTALIQHAESCVNENRVGDNTRMKQILGVQPRTMLLEGLRRMIEH